MFTGCNSGDTKCLRTESRGWRRGVMSGRRWLTVRVMIAMLDWVGEVNMVLGYVRWRHTESFRDLG